MSDMTGFVGAAVAEATGPCGHCTHPEEEHRGPSGECRHNYAPFIQKPTTKQREQCLCTHFMKVTGSPSKTGAT